MEKEVVKLEFNNIFLSFYYEEAFIKSKAELEEYKTWIMYGIKAIEDFVEINKEKELYINLSLTSEAEIKEINAETDR